MLGTKFHYGNCKQDYAELKHDYEKQKTKINALEQTLRDNESIIIQLTTEINELKAIHHYEREQLEIKVAECDKEHTNLAQELKDLQETYKDCLEKKRACKAELMQLKQDTKYAHVPDTPPLQINVIDDKPEVISNLDAEEAKNESKPKRKRK